MSNLYVRKHSYGNLTFYDSVTISDISNQLKEDFIFFWKAYKKYHQMQPLTNIALNMPLIVFTSYLFIIIIIYLY